MPSVSVQLQNKLINGNIVIGEDKMLIDNNAFLTVARNFGVCNQKKNCFSVK